MKTNLKLNAASTLLALFTSLSSTQCKPEDDSGKAPAPEQAAQPDQAPPPVAPPKAPAPAAKPKEASSAKDDGPQVRVAIDGMPAFGSSKALVTIVAFTDYQCPYCAKADANLATLKKEYGDSLRLVLASHPLPMHDRAAPAARAFLAAVEQGKGEQMHARLFTKQDQLDEAGLRNAAQELGLNLEKFDKSRQGSSTEEALKKAEALGASLNVEGTPTFFINGRHIVGARPIDTFRAVIDEEMIRAQALVDKGTPAHRVYDTLMESLPAHVMKKSAAGMETFDEVVDVTTDDAPLRGSSRAPVSIVFFSDFECPFCVKAEKTLKELEAANPGKVRVAFRHRPLPFHSHAKLAAKASIAAEKQGKFWEYHDVLIQHRDALERESLSKYAAEINLDVRRFERDLDDPALDARIEADDKRAEALGVKGTPTAFVNGRRITGAQPLQTWQMVVEKSLEKPLLKK